MQLPSSLDPSGTKHSAKVVLLTVDSDPAQHLTFQLRFLACKVEKGLVCPGGAWNIADGADPYDDAVLRNTAMYASPLAILPKLRKQMHDVLQAFCSPALRRTKVFFLLFLQSSISSPFLGSISPAGFLTTRDFFEGGFRSCQGSVSDLCCRVAVVVVISPETFHRKFSGICDRLKLSTRICQVTYCFPPGGGEEVTQPNRRTPPI